MNYVISHIFVHNNKNAFNKFVVNNKFLSNIKKKTNTNNVAPTKVETAM